MSSRCLAVVRPSPRTALGASGRLGDGAAQAVTSDGAGKPPRAPEGGVGEGASEGAGKPRCAPEGAAQAVTSEGASEHVSERTPGCVSEGAEPATPARGAPEPRLAGDWLAGGEDRHLCVVGQHHPKHLLQ